MGKKKIAFHTLGCKLNFSETSTIARQFQDDFVKVGFNDMPDIFVIHTCSVTEHTNKKCRDVINKAVKQNPFAIIAVIGCYAQLKPDEIRNIPGVNIVLGGNEKFNLYEHIKDYINNSRTSVIIDNKQEDKFISSYSIGDRTRSFLKIQDGCDYYCAYCTVPHARGKSRSDTIENTIRIAKEIASTDVKEIILTGVNIGDYGKNHNETFYNLLCELDKIDGIDRFRISSIEPNLLTDEIIHFVAKSKKFMPHFHIPLQSGSDKILKAMNRRYNRDLFSGKINMINSNINNCFIGIDVIVGLPGETEDDFAETYNYLNDLEFSCLHVFSYSERENTKAIKMKESVPNSLRKKRSIALLELSEQKKIKFYNKNIPSNVEVLFESTNNSGYMYGFTRNYIKVKRPYSKELVNKIHRMELSGVDNNGNAV